MDELGLPPSSTGAPGGARVGYRMSHYILPGGAYRRHARSGPLARQGLCFAMSDVLEFVGVYRPKPGVPPSQAYDASGYQGAERYCTWQVSGCRPKPSGSLPRDMPQDG